MANSVLSIKNSFCRLENFTPETIAILDDCLSYQNDIEADKAYLLGQLRQNKVKRTHCKDKTKLRGLQKHYGALKGELEKLEATEFVHWLKDDQFPTGHLAIVQDVLEALKYNYETKDLRIKPDSEVLLRWMNKPHDPRYYQEEMIALGLEHGRGVFESAVGTGKSLIMFYLLMELKVTSLFIIPSLPLLNQLKLDLITHFGFEKVQHVTSDDVKKERPLKPIRLVSVQTMASLQKNEKLKYLVEDVNALFGDEIHHSGSASYTNLLPELDHIYYRFGFTGTFIRNDNRTLDMWGFLSTKLYTYTAAQATKEGFLTPLKVLMHSIQGKEFSRYQTEYDKHYCGDKKGNGNKVFLMKIREILEDYATKDDQVLILVSRKDKSGAIIHKYLNQLGFENTYISGDDDKDTIRASIEYFNDKKIRILIGSQVVGEGIDICSTDHLIMAQGGKSEIAIVQATGRAVRLFDGKSIAYLHDFRFLDTKYMNKHANQRIDIYERNFSPHIFEVDKVA